MARLLTPSSRAAQTAKDLPTVTCAFLYQYTFIAGARSLGALPQPRDDTTKALYELRIRGTSLRKSGVAAPVTILAGSRHALRKCNRVRNRARHKIEALDGPGWLSGQGDD